MPIKIFHGVNIVALPSYPPTKLQLERARMRENKHFLVQTRLEEYVRAVNKTSHWISDLLKLYEEERADFFEEIGMVKMGHVAKFNFYLRQHKFVHTMVLRRYIPP